MEKLFKILAQGKMPDFSQMMEALNDISDVDWNRLEASQLSIRDVFKTKCIPKGGVFGSGQFCESCG